MSFQYLYRPQTTVNIETILSEHFYGLLRFDKN